MYNGDPPIQVIVDGQQAGGAYDISAHHSLDQTQTIRIAGNFDPTVAHRVQVMFVNDTWDGTLNTDRHDRHVSLGEDRPGPHAAVMLINGAVSFNVPAGPPASGGTSGSGASAVGTSAGAVPSGPGFYVSPTGNDSNPGTLAAPFATLARAQQAMENSSIKATYVEGGTYNLTSTLTLTAADTGETWQYYPANGVDSAILDGGRTVDLIAINGGSHVTINGLKVQNFNAYGISVINGSSNTIENCDVGFNTVTSWQSAGIYFLGNVPNSLITNNYVHDVGSQGIALFDNWSGVGGTGNIDGTIIQNNVVVRAVQRMSDGGSIYMEEHGGTTTSHTMIRNNFVRDYGAPGVSGQAGIYLDQGSNNVTITGNIVGPPAQGSVGTGNAGAIAFQDSTGFNNTFSGNIVDLGDTGRELTVNFWYETGSGPQNPTNNNTFEGNVIVSGFTGNQNTNFTGARGVSYFQHPSYPTPPTIQNNIYYNYAGGQVRTDGTIIGDSHPIFVNPQISGRTYTVASTSPVLRGPVNFTPIVGGWGPPGFVIPQDGTAPSSPHSSYQRAR